MALKKIGSQEPSNDLPWASDYIDSPDGQAGDSCLVKEVKKTPKGFLVIGEKFKGFLFVKSAIAGFLEEALSVWVTNSTINYPLFMIAEDDGKVTLAIDEELDPSVWVMDKKGKSWEQKVKKSRVSGLNTPASNPFLPTPPPTQSRGKNKRLPDTAEEPWMNP